MICNKCGVELKYGEKFCHACGAAVVEEARTPESVPTAPAAGPAKAVAAAKAVSSFGGRMIASIIGLLSGLLSLIFGLGMFGMSVGSYTNSQYYGGDAYTGIQQAGAAAANNARHVASIAKTGFAFILIAGGLALIAYFLMKFFEAKSGK